MNATIITRTDALEMFAKVESTFVGMDIATIPVLLGGKANPMQGKVRKVSTFVAMVGNAHKYANKVTRLAQKECDSVWGKGEVELMPFQAEKLWKGAGEHIAGAVIRHKETDSRYIMYYPSNGTPDVHYELDGQVIAKEKIEGLNEKPREGKAVEVDGVEMVLAVFPTTLKIESLKAFRLDGQEYIIKENI